MKSLLVTVLLIAGNIAVLHLANSQTFDPYIQQVVNDLEYDSLLNKLQTFENLGIKQAGTSSLDETAAWLIKQHQQYGYTDIQIDTFQYGGNEVYNLIITKTGAIYPETYIIIDGHYDTYNGPGVNDNGTGTAIVLELARMLADIETAYSVRFIHFTVEELGLIGSTHYVENTVIPEDMDIRLVLNIDEVGGIAGMANSTITCERDEWPPASNNAASAAFTDTLANLTEMYSTLNTNISYAYGSDYVPFMNNGYVVTGYYEYNESPYPHSINDSLSNMDPEYVFEVLKASLAAGIYFSGAYEPATGVTPNHTDESMVSVYPNPFSDQFFVQNNSDDKIRLEVSDLRGKHLHEQTIPEHSDVQVRFSGNAGLYIYRIIDEGNNLRQSGRLIRLQ
ncbi:MAG: M28 family peptidase [Bacteroidales bacterium]|nr:M28 family peptidase [Bacteroidales bacterium]